MTGRSAAIFSRTSRSASLSSSCGRSLRIGEVEAQVVGADVAALLGNRLAQHLLQGPLEDVGGGVILPGGTAVQADRHRDLLADVQRALGKLAAMDHRIGNLRRFFDDEPACRPAVPGWVHPRGRGCYIGGHFNDAGVADLAAGLGVETGLLKDQADLGFARDLALLVKARGIDPAENRGFALIRVVLVQVFRRRQFGVDQAHQERIGLLRRPGPLFLFLHQLLETLEIHAQAAFLGHKLRQVDGEAVGVVKLESVLAADRLGGSLSRPVGGDGKEVQAAVERPAEAGLLRLNHGRDVLGPLPDLGKGVAETVHDHGDQLVEERIVQIELAAEPRGPAENPAQDVAPALVGGRGAVGDREGQSADMVRDDAEGIIGLLAELRGVLVARQLAGRPDDRHEQVGVVVAALVLEDGDDPLQAGTGIDVLGGQRHEIARRLAVELDEDEVPQLDVPGAVAVDAALVARDALLVAAVGAQIDVDLAARAAGAGLAHFPEVLFLAEREDALRRQGGQLRPEPRRLGRPGAGRLSHRPQRRWPRAGRG